MSQHLEKFAQDVSEDPIGTTATQLEPQDDRPHIAIVDGMVLVQKLTKKPPTIVTVQHLSKWFNDRLMSMTRDFDVFLVFDTYKPDSLKNSTRDWRRQGKDPIQYQITDDANIKNIPMKRFLS